MKIKSEFAKSVLTLLTGTSIGQAIPIAISPLLTRLYSPEEFGILSLFISFNAIAVILATGRYELAIMLPKSDESAINVLGLAANLTFLVCLIFLLIIVISNQYVVKFINYQNFSIWLFLMPLSVAFFGISQILSSWLNRNRDYFMLACTDIVLKFVSELTKLALGFARTSGFLFVNGLMVGYILGIISAAGILIWQFIKHDWKKLKFIDYKKLTHYAKRYNKFPLYNVPYSLLAMISQSSMIIALSFFGYLEAAGFLGFVKSAMFLLPSLLSTSLGRVFFKEAAVNFRTPRLEKITLNLMSGIVDIFTPALVLFIFWAPDIFRIIFGKTWVEAGRYAAIFTPAVYLFLFTSWTSRMFEVAQKQEISFVIQLVWDSVIIVSICGALYGGVKPLMCVFIYTGLFSLYHITYLIAIFKISKFDSKVLYKSLRKIAIISTPLILIILIVKSSGASVLSQWLISLVVTICTYLLIAIRYYRQNLNPLNAITPRD